MFRFLGAIAVAAAFAAGIGSSGASPRFELIEVRLVSQDAGEGVQLPVNGTDGQVAVEDETLLGTSDFVSVGDVEWTEGKPGFNVGLTPGGADKYERISTENAGRTLAVIVDGEVLVTARILDPVRAEGFLLTVNDEDEARALAANLRQAVAR